MNTITFVSFYATGEKNGDVIFLFSIPFFTRENKKTKIIRAFFTILSKITLTDEKKGSKSSQNVL